MGRPAIARTFTNEGAGVLVNVSNDGYLGPTPVMRQHLANAVFRAVENNRVLLRVTNSGITAYIDPTGQIVEETSGFGATVLGWQVSQETEAKTFYTQNGDVFAYGCALISLGLISATFMTKQKRIRNSVSEARP